MINLLFPKVPKTFSVSETHIKNGSDRELFQVLKGQSVLHSILNTYDKRRFQICPQLTIFSNRIYGQKKLGFKKNPIFLTKKARHLWFVLF